MELDGTIAIIGFAECWLRILCLRSVSSVARSITINQSEKPALQKRTILRRRGVSVMTTSSFRALQECENARMWRRRVLFFSRSTEVWAKENVLQKNYDCAPKSECIQRLIHCIFSSNNINNRLTVVWWRPTVLALSNSDYFIVYYDNFFWDSLVFSLKTLANINKMCKKKLK